MAGEWPLQDFIELGPLPGAVPCARLHTRQLLWEWGMASLSDSAELLVSELDQPHYLHSHGRAPHGHTPDPAQSAHFTALRDQLTDQTRYTDD